MEIQVLASDRHKNVTGLNLLMGSQNVDPLISVFQTQALFEMLIQIQEKGRIDDQRCDMSNLLKVRTYFLWRVHWRFFFCRNVESACCFVRIKTKLQNVLNFFKCEKRRKHMYNFVVYYVFVTHKGQAKNSCRKKKLIDYHMYTTCNQTRNLYIYKLAWLASDEFSCENSFIVLGLGLWYVIIYIFGSKS